MVISPHRNVLLLLHHRDLGKFEVFSRNRVRDVKKHSISRDASNSDSLVGGIGAPSSKSLKINEGNTVMDHYSSTLLHRAAAAAVLCFLAGCQSPAQQQPRMVSDDTRARLAQALLASGDRDGAAEALKTPAARESAEATLSLANAETLISAGQVDRGMHIAKEA